MRPSFETDPAALCAALTQTAGSKASSSAHQSFSEAATKFNQTYQNPPKHSHLSLYPCEDLCWLQFIFHSFDSLWFRPFDFLTFSVKSSLHPEKWWGIIVRKSEKWSNYIHFKETSSLCWLKMCCAPHNIITRTHTCTHRTVLCCPVGGQKPTKLHKVFMLHCSITCWSNKPVGVTYESQHGQ